MTSIRYPLRHLVVSAVGAVLCATSALAASPSASADAQARYRQDMAVCNSGDSNQDAATCRKEAKNALAASRSGSLDKGSPETLRQNALARCAEHDGDDRIACEARVLDSGSEEGSVAAGGILRKSVTIVPANK